MYLFNAINYQLNLLDFYGSSMAGYNLLVLFVIWLEKEETYAQHPDNNIKIAHASMAGTPNGYSAQTLVGVKQILNAS